MSTGGHQRLTAIQYRFGPSQRSPADQGNR